MPRSRPAPLVVVSSCLSTDGRLRVAEVRPGLCILSTGEELIVRYEKLQALCEAVCQEGSVIWMRSWIGRDGPELIELHRVAGEQHTPVCIPDPDVSL